MAWKSDNSYANEDETIPYDLRQIYAIQIVGEHLQDIARARKADDFPNYLKTLKDLWIVSRHKIEEKDSSAPEKYGELLNKAIEVINKHVNAFKNKNGDAVGRANIENVLNNIEMFLYNRLNKAKIFGSKWEDEGL